MRSPGSSSGTCVDAETTPPVDVPVSYLYGAGMTGRAAALAQQMRERVALGDLGPGGALESEAALGARYGVSRVTVRRALEELRAQGLLESRRGAGWFATSGTFHQSLAVGTFRHAESAVASAGKTVRRSVVEFGFGSASQP